MIDFNWCMFNSKYIDMNNIFNINENSNTQIDQLVIFNLNAFMNSYNMQNYWNSSLPQQIPAWTWTNNQIKNSGCEVFHWNDLVPVFNNTFGTANTWTKENLNSNSTQLNSSVDRMMLLKNCSRRLYILI